jgi:hypothetical protein
MVVVKGSGERQLLLGKGGEGADRADFFEAS